MPASSLRHTIQRLKVDDKDVDIGALDEESARTLLQRWETGQTAPNMTFAPGDRVRLLQRLAALRGAPGGQGTIAKVSPGVRPNVELMRVQARDRWVYGLEILRVLQQGVRVAIARAQQYGEVREVEGGFAVVGGREWLLTAGRMAIAITGIDERRDAKMLETQIHVGFGATEIDARRSGQTGERLYFSEADPSYERILGLRRTLLPDLTDPEVAQILLQKIKAGPQLEFVRNAPTEFLDGFVALLAGMEASRNNAGFATAVMTLELVASGKLTFAEAFYENQYGGQYPMASIQTGPENMKRRRAYISESWDFDLHPTQLMRQKPVSDAVPIKEIVLLINWLREESGGTLESMTAEELLRFANIRFDRLMDTYYGSWDLSRDPAFALVGDQLRSVREAIGASDGGVKLQEAMEGLNGARNDLAASPALGTMGKRWFERFTEEVDQLIFLWERFSGEGYEDDAPVDELHIAEQWQTVYGRYLAARGR